MARAQEEYKKSREWHQRILEDLEYRRELRRLTKLGDSMSTILVGLGLLVKRPIDTSKLGVPPEIKKPLPPPPPKRPRRG